MFVSRRLRVDLTSFPRACCPRQPYAERGSRERAEHMVNAGKYFVSLLSLSLASVGNYSRITSINVRSDPGQVAWLATLLLGTLYSYAWDIVMDWALVELDFDGGKRTFPRIRWAITRDRVFRSKKFYAWAMVSNLVGRFAWAVTITPHGKGGVFFILNGGLTGEAAGTFVAVLELLRRAQWTFLRLVGTRSPPPRCRFIVFVFASSRASVAYACVAVAVTRKRHQYENQMKPNKIKNMTKSVDIWEWRPHRSENEYLNNSARYRSVVAAPMLLDDVGSSNWDSEWKFEKEENEANTKTITVYAVVAANALVALAVIGVFYLVYSR